MRITKMKARSLSTEFELRVVTCMLSWIRLETSSFAPIVLQNEFKF